MISEEFIEAFHHLVANYNGITPSRSTSSWGVWPSKETKDLKDANIEYISTVLHAYLDVMSQAKGSDSIGYQCFTNGLLSLAITTHDTDHAFFMDYKNFFIKCQNENIIPKIINDDGTINVSISDDIGESSIYGLIQELSKNNAAITKIHKRELAAERTRNETLLEENERLRQENDLLKSQLRAQAMVQAQSERLEEAKSLLLELNEVMGISIVPQFTLSLDNPESEESIESLEPPVFEPSYFPPAPPSEPEKISVSMLPVNHATDMSVMVLESAVSEAPPSRPVPMPPPPMLAAPAVPSSSSATKVPATKAFPGGGFFEELQLAIQKHEANNVKKKALQTQSNRGRSRRNV